MDVVRAALESASSLAGLLGQPIGISIANGRGQILGSSLSPGAPASYEAECRTLGQTSAQLKLDTTALRADAWASPVSGALPVSVAGVPDHGTTVIVGEWNSIVYVVAVRCSSGDVERACAERAAALLADEMSERPQLSASELREAMGSFVTGVVVAIVRSPELDRPVGMTATGLVSLSLNPPLVGLSIATTAQSHTAFVQSTEFTVNVLHADQAELALQLARSGPAKFDGVDLVPTPAGTWRLADARTVLHCRTRGTIGVGDHTLVVGEIHTANNVQDEPALLFLGGGQFAYPTAHAPVAAAHA